MSSVLRGTPRVSPGLPFSDTPRPLSDTPWQLRRPHATPYFQCLARLDELYPQVVRDFRGPQQFAFFSHLGVLRGHLVVEDENQKRARRAEREVEADGKNSEFHHLAPRT